MLLFSSCSWESQLARCSSCGRAHMMAHSLGQRSMCKIIRIIALIASPPPTSQMQATFTEKQLNITGQNVTSLVCKHVRWIMATVRTPWSTTMGIGIGRRWWTWVSTSHEWMPPPFEQLLFTTKSSRLSSFTCKSVITSWSLLQPIRIEQTWSQFLCHWL